MKLKPIAVGNATCMTTVLLYVLCWVLANVLPSFCHWAFQGWFHWLNASPLMRAEEPSLGPGRLVTGFLSLVAMSWVAGWLFATIYNELAMNKRQRLTSDDAKRS